MFKLWLEVFKLLEFLESHVLQESGVLMWGQEAVF